jgi:hypothetical protein
MENILFLDFELNQPLALLNKFKHWLRKEGWKLEMFWAKDYSPEQNQKPTFDEKLQTSNLLFIRKPLTFLTSPNVRKKIQHAVLNDKKNLLLMMSFTDIETLEILKEFLIPFKIEPSDIRAMDEKTNLDERRSVVFHKKNKCFSHNEIFNRVQKVVIPDANILYLKPPAKILIRGNPSTETYSLFPDESNGPKGSDVIVGAYYEDSGRVIVVNSSVFLDNYFDFNKPFIKNVMNWLNPKTS